MMFCRVISTTRVIYAISSRQSGWRLASYEHEVLIPLTMGLQYASNIPYNFAYLLNRGCQICHFSFLSLWCFIFLRLISETLYLYWIHSRLWHLSQPKLQDNWIGHEWFEVPLFHSENRIEKKDQTWNRNQRADAKAKSTWKRSWIHQELWTEILIKNLGI